MVSFVRQLLLNKVSSTVLGVCLTFLLVVSPVLAAPYGESNYGDGEYNVGFVPTPSPTPTTAPSSSGSNSSGSSSSSSSSSSSGPKECTGQKPGGTPELFQIDRNGSVATLHVTPGGDPYNSFFVSYGIGGETGQYAEYFNYEHATGVMIHEVRDLDPKMVYSFRVQPMNGCVAGDWSNTLAAGTKSGKYFKYGMTQLGVRTKSVAASLRNLVAPKKATTGTTDTKAIESSNSGTTTTRPSTAPAAPTKAAQPTPSPEPQQSGGIINWFKGLFR